MIHFICDLKLCMFLNQLLKCNVAVICQNFANIILISVCIISKVVPCSVAHGISSYTINQITQLNHFYSL